MDTFAGVKIQTWIHNIASNKRILSMDDEVKRFSSKVAKKLTLGFFECVFVAFFVDYFVATLLSFNSFMKHSPPFLLITSACLRLV